MIGGGVVFLGRDMPATRPLHEWLRR